MRQPKIACLFIIKTYTPIISLFGIVGFLMLKINYQKLKESEELKMITIADVNKFNNTLELYGLSTDEKPTDKFNFCGVDYRITNSSTFYEMDSKAAFIFSEEGKTWYEV